MTTKEFGKLSADQLRQLVALLPELEKMRREFQEDLKKSAKAQKAISEDCIWWAPLYELPYERHLALFMMGIGLDKMVLEAAGSQDPQQKVLDVIQDDSFIDTLPPLDITDLGAVIGFLISIERSLESLLVWGRYLNELVSYAREGDDSSLFKAVRIDPTVLSCPSIARRLSQAVAVSDTRFLRAVRAAMEGRTQKQAKYLRSVRFAIEALNEGGVNAISDKSLRNLFIEKLGIYKDSPLGSPEKALRKHFRAAKRKSTT